MSRGEQPQEDEPAPTVEDLMAALDAEAAEEDETLEPVATEGDGE